MNDSPGGCQSRDLTEARRRDLAPAVVGISVSERRREQAPRPTTMLTQILENAVFFPSSVAFGDSFPTKGKPLNGTGIPSLPLDG